MRYESYIFLDVVWLAEVLKPLFCHQRMEIGDMIFLNIGRNRRIILSKPDQKQSWRRLENDGVLEPELWEVFCPNGLSRYVLPALELFGLTFPLPNDDIGSLVLLLRLKKEPPISVSEDLARFCEKRSPVLKGIWKMPQGVPPGALEQVIMRCCRFGSALTFWRSSVLVKGALNKVEDIFLLLVEYSEDEQRLEMRVYGDLGP